MNEIKECCGKRMAQLNTIARRYFVTTTFVCLICRRDETVIETRRGEVK